MTISRSTHSPFLTLEAVLCDTRSEEFRAFAAYLQHTYCLENLSFWLAVECYTTHASRPTTKNAVAMVSEDPVAQNSDDSFDTLPTPLTGTLMEAQCHAIVSMYITSDAPHEINIPCDIRQRLLDQLRLHNYHPTIFASASNYILELMRSNSFIPWILELQPQSSSKSSPSPHPHQLQQQHQRSLSFPILTLGDRLSRLKPVSRRSMSLMDDCVLDQPLPTIQPKSMLKRIKHSLFRTDLQTMPANHTLRPTGIDGRWPTWKKLQR
ncbi:RGS domain-containing protein [Phycomyces nitens]|nr:RGS domain-containing protein [Phycomyces nitens]KAI9024449.1 RGS domain-containing protein [Phycomyces nitens]